MKAHVTRWGNSLGVRIPKDIAGQAGITEGSRVEIEMAGGQIVITPARPTYKLQDLLAGMTPEAMSEAFDWGPEVGREAVDE
jgi:antitoxin MazE